MTEIYGAPQLPLTGSELVSIRQPQNERLALCTAPLSAIAAYVVAQVPQSSGGITPSALNAALVTWASGLPTSPPSATGFYLDNGVIAFFQAPAA
jgi:hypothetical protein